jgi:PAS domain S-box-containing protein
MWRVTALLVLIFAGLTFGVYQTWQKREQEIFVRHSAVLKTTYDTTIHLYQTYAETLYEEVINRAEIVQLMEEAYDAPPEQQAVLRGRLYRLLYSSYNRLIKKNFRQLHFLFPDNSSFIRFHRLELYGDSLTDIRESFRLVNAHHKPVFGFENGRVYCGFRNVFPLQYKEKYVGSVEASVSFKAISKSMKSAVPDHDYLFVQKKDMVVAKAFSSELKIYTDVAVAPGYVVEDQRMLGLEEEDPVLPLARRLNPILGSRPQVQENIQKEISFVTRVNDQGKNYLVTGLPIHNIKDEQVAYIISYEENDEIAVLWTTFRYLILGQTFLLLALGFFIWKRLEVVEQLRSKESRLRAITQSMGDALYVNDAEGKIIFSNRAMEQQLGYSLYELFGRDAHILLHRHNQQGEVETRDKCGLVKENLAGRPYEGGENYFQHKDGSIIPVEVKASPLQLEHGRCGSVVIFRDISDRLQSESDRIKVKKLESISVLAGGIAHDFNNLLTVIIGNIELAGMASADNLDVNRLLGKAQDAAKRASKLTNQLLTFSKGGFPVLSEVDLGSLLPDIVQLALSGSSVHCEFMIDDDLWPVRVDTNQISQVIQNLLMNAMQAMDHSGTVTISCSNDHLANNQISPQLTGKYVRIRVEDTGTGIARQDMDRIFDPYFTTQEMGSAKGSGLGLAIVHSIIKKHKGYIEVESTEGVGTIFSIYLPAVAESHETSISESKPAQQPVGDRILVMDDEVVLLDLVSSMLTKLGYEAQRAENGEEAIKLYIQAMEAGKPFDAVILDLTIQGGMSGKQTMAELRTIDPTVVAIISSGYTNDPVMSDYRNYGFKGGVAKPYEMETLAATLNRVLAQKRSAAK